ncbi:MAG TPA: hypothetical protein VH253_05355 [Phycisphaerae bacterium]|nr:hypothetical protein [Phycisphaerae bacterium]
MEKRLGCAMLITVLLAGCAGQQAHPRTRPATQPATPQAMTPDLRDVLASLARAHQQKTELAFYTSTPLRPVDEPFKQFFKTMGDVQGDLLKQLKHWAGEHHVDLTFHYSNDIEGRAQKFMEDRQEKVVRGDDKISFERDMMINMSTDYDWQISLLTETLPLATDPELRAYLQNSLRAHEEGSRQIRGLLSQYKFQP